MRFLHAADIHLDSPLAGLASRAGERADALVGATRRAFVGLVDAAIERQAAFLLIAGDLYDGDWTDFATGLFFVEQMARLERAGIRVAICRGNHDAANGMTRRLPLPPNVHVFASNRAETVSWDDLGVALHGRSFGQRHETGNLARDYPPARPGLLNIGLLHSSVTGRPNHDVYAPCSLEDLRGKNYDYWALGHVHAREVLQRDPWIVFSGNLQGRHANETGAKGCMLVTVEAGRIASAEPLILDVLRWSRVSADLAGCADADAAAEQVRRALADAVAEAEGRPLAVRLTLCGETPLHRHLTADPDQTDADCAAAAARCGGDVWLERVVVATTDPPDRHLSPAGAQADALAELMRTIDGLRHGAAGRDGLREELKASLARIPPAVLGAAGLADITDDVLSQLLDDAQAILLDRLLSGEDGR